MSIYTQCSQAIEELSASGVVFTEIDAVNAAALDSWGKPQFKDALKYAGQILSAQYRDGRLVRFGPIQAEGNTPDYGRREGGIVYAAPSDLSGIKFWETPNGNIPVLFRHADLIQRPGRRKGSARADNRLWSDQEITAKILKPVRAPRVTKTAINNELDQVRAQLAERDARVSQLESEIESLRHELSIKSDPNGPVTRREVEDLVLSLTGSMEERISKFEEQLA